MRALFRAVALSGLLTACGGGGGGDGPPAPAQVPTPAPGPAPAPAPSPSPSPAPSPAPAPTPASGGTAGLTISISGVALETALVRVDGPAGTAPQFLSADSTLSNLPAGTYTIVPSDALTGSTLQRAPTQTVTLGDGETRPVTVSYTSSGALSLRMQEIIPSTAGLSGPIDLQAPAGDARLFIAERPGRIRIFQGGTLLATPFLDIAARVAIEGEGGLLSFTFHPQFPAQPYVYVMYTIDPGATGADIVVERFQLVAGNANQLQNTGVQVLRVPHPGATNHYGGRVAFGPDGKLYVSIGDGGSIGGPNGNAQNAATLLGKLLRIDVSTLPYTIPADNPAWTGVSGARRENWAIGLRNPWRYTFDAPTGLLYVADVGEDQREEINTVAASSAGLNFGWNIMEGSQCFGTSCATTGLTLPVFDYDHGQGCSITGGYVYRGAAMPELQGRYFYSDFCSGFLRSVRFDSGLLVERVQWLPNGIGNIQSFGQDGVGNLYMLAINGRVLRVERN